MALIKKEIIKRNYESIKTPKGREIFILYFFKEMSQKEIIEKMNCKKRARDTQVLANLVSNYTSAWEEMEYVIKRKIPDLKSKSKSHPYKYIYRTTMQPFFDYAKHILSNISFEEKVKRDQIKIPKELEKKSKTPKPTEKKIAEYKETEFDKVEKEILEYIFSFKEVKEIVNKNDDLIQGIIRFLERIFFYETDTDWPHRINHFFRKGFFIKNKSYVKLTKKRYLDKIEEIREFEKISFRHFRKLRNKIKLISDFSDQDYFDLTVDTSLRKYQYMPSLKEIKEEKDPIKRHMLVRTWIQIYFFDEIPEGYN